MNCAVCGIRKPKRYCMGVNANICSICCGTEREQSIDCPLDCEYLRDAHEHERLPEFDASQVPNNEIEVTEEFLQENDIPLFYLGSAAFEGAAKMRGATDYDVREGLEALIRTWKALETGLYYDPVPTNPFAASVYQMVRLRVEEIRKREAEGDAGAFELKDPEVLKILVFLQRLEYSSNNGRKRSRAFVAVLRKFHIDQLTHPGNSPEPDEPGIIL